MPTPTEPSIYGKLLEIQSELKVAKSQYNSFGGFAYRSKEDILEAAKPLCHARGLVLVCDDGIECPCDKWVYATATACIIDVATGDKVMARGNAREAETKKGMDASQITGTASSYAGKRALGNLFAIDDTADSDTPADTSEKPKAFPCVATCRSCGSTFKFASQDQIDGMQCCPRPDYVVTG